MSGHNEGRAVLIDELHTIEEAAQILRIHERTVRRRVASGELAYVAIGGRVMFERRELDAYIGRQRRRRSSEARQPA
jgi:excisionase family DNA binding protein